MSKTSALASTRRADRPRRHAGTSGTEQAIFAATERLLADSSLNELSIAAIIDAAGVSRATFYFYFSSKFAVVSGLLASVMDDIFDVVRPFNERPSDLAPEAALRQSLEAGIALWQKHRPALRAIHEHWNSTDELRALWTSVVDRFTAAIATEIDRERRAGIVPPGVDSRALAASLLWGTESVLYVAGLEVSSYLADESRTLEPLLAIWTGALYAGSQQAAKSARRASPQAKSRPSRAKAVSSRTGTRPSQAT
jgi:AcrR family transcriptional regulator